MKDFRQSLSLQKPKFQVYDLLPLLHFSFPLVNKLRPIQGKIGEMSLIIVVNDISMLSIYKITVIIRANI